MKYYYTKASCFYYFSQAENNINSKEIAIKYDDNKYLSYLSYYNSKYPLGDKKSLIPIDLSDNDFENIRKTCKKLKSILDRYYLKDFDLDIKKEGYFIGNIGESSVIFRIDKIDNASIDYIKYGGFGFSITEESLCTGYSVKSVNKIFYTKISKKDWYKFMREYISYNTIIKNFINKYEYSN